MLYTIKIVQIFLTLILTFLVLIQSKGKGLSSSFSDIAGQFSTKRGVEKIIFGGTILLGILFVLNSLLLVVLH